MSRLSSSRTKLGVLLLTLSAAIAPVSATPPACQPTRPGLFMQAEHVVEVKILEVKTSRSAKDRTLSASATYEVVDVYKGTLKKGDRVKISPVCNRIENPVQGSFCRGSSDTELTGVHWQDDKPEMLTDRHWVLNLDRDNGRLRDLAFEKFHYGACFKKDDDVAAELRAEFDRMMRNVR